MSAESIRKFYTKADFLALGSNTVNYNILQAQLAALSLTEAIAGIVPQANQGVIVEWDNLPTQADFNAVDGVIHAHVGGSTTKSPFRAVTAVDVDAPNSTPVSAVVIQTPPLDSGDYQISGAMMFLLTSIVAGTYAQVQLKLNDGIVNGTTTNIDQPVAYNFSFPLTVAAGATIKLEIFIVKLGVGANVARILGGFGAIQLAVDPL